MPAGHTMCACPHYIAHQLPAGRTMCACPHYICLCAQVSNDSLVTRSPCPWLKGFRVSSQNENRSPVSSQNENRPPLPSQNEKQEQAKWCHPNIPHFFSRTLRNPHPTGEPGRTTSSAEPPRPWPRRGRTTRRPCRPGRSPGPSRPGGSPSEAHGRHGGRGVGDRKARKDVCCLIHRSEIFTYT